MRKGFFLVPFLGFFLPAMPAWPAPAPSGEAQLFARLAHAASPEEAHPIEQQLDALFRASGSATADLLMARAGSALQASDNKTARRLIEAVTRIAPKFAEAWHARANLEAAAGEDGAAMVSLQKTVLLNPRQFHALDELAAMLEDYGDKPGALKLYRRALALDPQLQDAAERVRALSKSVEGQDI